MRVVQHTHYLTVTALDAPGAGGAQHHYDIHSGAVPLARVHFQEGPLKVAGINGITHEVLLLLVIDRLQSFQAGPFACPENAQALEHATAALEALESRTRKRQERGVEGTNTV
jgi:hypothetical protein